MSEQRSPITEVTAYSITAGIGAGIGWVGGGATESLVYPDQVRVRDNLDAQINYKNVDVETVKTDLARRELGYSPQLKGSVDSLHAIETRLHTQIAELRHDKQPLDDAHDSYVNTTILVGMGVALAIRAGARAYRRAFPKDKPAG